LFAEEQVAQSVALFHEVNFFSSDACYDFHQGEIMSDQSDSFL